jgi:hypothetical protein
MSNQTPPDASQAQFESSLAALKYALMVAELSGYHAEYHCGACAHFRADESPEMKKRKPGIPIPGRCSAKGRMAVNSRLKQTSLCHLFLLGDGGIEWQVLRELEAAFYAATQTPHDAQTQQLEVHQMAVRQLQDFLEHHETTDLLKLIEMAETECLCEYDRARLAEEAVEELTAPTGDLEQFIRSYVDSSIACQRLGQEILSALRRLAEGTSNNQDRLLARRSREREQTPVADTEPCPPETQETTTTPFQEGPVPVLLVSPFGGTSEEKTRHLQYARRCARHCMDLGEAPFGSHLIYTQLLNDDFVPHRKKGTSAGLAWASLAPRAVVYTDLGITKGMQDEIRHMESQNKPVCKRTLPTGYKKLDLSITMSAFREPTTTAL